MLTICLVTEPDLTPKEQEIIKTFGGWITFMECFGLNPKDEYDVDEAMVILKILVVHDGNKENVIAAVLDARQARGS
jgi:hypothetical protein